jgi:CRISPR/Cas system-associated exonuclease Cas4 (RecB family)
MAVGDARLVVAPDAATRLAAARSWLAALAPDAAALVIGPSWEACDDLTRAAAVASGAQFGIVRLTLDRLAVRLAARALAARNLTPPSGLAVSAVVARAVDRLAVDGKLGRFTPVAKHPGLPAALGRTLDELRLAGIDERALRDLGPLGTDLAVVAERVARELVADGIADRALVLETARAAVERNGAPGLVGVPLLLVDVPIASAAEEAFIGALAARAPRTLATAVTGDARSVAALARACGTAPEPAPGPSATPASALGRLQIHLFSDVDPPKGALDDSVRLSAWPGEARECVEVARAIQVEASAGVPFDRMAVAVHAVGEYAAHLEEAFGRANVPYFFARGTARPHPSGRALLALLACAADGLSARGFAEYLSLGQVPDPGARVVEPFVPPENDLVPSEPPAPDDDGPARATVDDPAAVPAIAGTLHAPRRWEELIVDAAVIGGVERWRRRLRGLANDLAAKRDGVAPDDELRAAGLDRALGDLRHLSAFALPLVERLAALPASATWGEWLDALRALALAALRRPEAVLATLNELAPMAPVGPVDLDEVRLVLTPRLRDLTVPPPRRRYGAVLVAPAAALRGLELDVVFVPGLAENLFPSKIVEDPILLDGARERLAGDRLVRQPDRIDRERLALRIAVGAARRRVHLSYPRVDVEKARPRVPSFYALEVLRAAEGRLPGFDDLGKRAEQAAHARLGWPAPERTDDAIDEAEYDLALLAPLLVADPETTIGTASYLLGANVHLRRALRARARRWIRRWTAADGLVDADPVAAEALAPHRMGVRAFSATALQHYAACPYRFFLYTVHRLEPRQDPASIEFMDPLTRGDLVHDVQFRVLTQLRDEGRLPLGPSSLKHAFELLDAALVDEAETRAEKLAPAIPRVWEDGVDAVRADLREWLRRHADATDGWVPHRFELSFDVAERDRAHADPSSIETPVPLPGGLLLRGAIDLVERREDGRLRVTDHKSGKVSAPAGVVVGGGAVLQPVLYALAAEELLKAPVVEGRLYYCTAVGEYTERVVELDAASRGAAATVIDAVGAALRDAFLPAAPAPGACRWCDYRSVCGPYEETRVERKPPERLAALTRLRELP